MITFPTVPPDSSVSGSAPIPGVPADSAARPLACAGFSDRGRRARNEDCFSVDAGSGLLVVADGMGGHVGGEVAARLAIDVIVEQMARHASLFGQWTYGYDHSLSLVGNRLRTAVQAAHMRLVEAMLAAPALAGMGTTVVAALCERDRVSVAWAGDSRLYLFGSEGLRLLTRDDSWVEAARESQDADEAALEWHPLRHALTNALGAVTGVQVHVGEAAIRPGEVVALTTDGVHAHLVDRHLAHVLSRRTLPAHAAADLVAAALGCGSPDNCTAIVAHCA